MKTTRIKNLLIIIFLLADLALGIILYTDHMASTQPGKEEIDAAVSLLHSRGISFDASLLPSGITRVPALTLQISPAADENGNIFFQENITEPLTEAFALSYLQKKHINTDFIFLADKKENSLTFREAYHDIMLVHSYITFSLQDDLLTVSGQLYTPESPQDTSAMQIHHALSALQKLCREPNLPTKAKIVSVSPGYAEYLSTEDRAYFEGSGIAVWVITLNNGNTYIYDAQG